ncbi:uncharacterized protein K441DRAFT_741654, partial [Cenococcum geophilum 1.58]
SYQEGRIALAILAIKQNQFHSVRYATVTYDVSRATLQRRRGGTLLRRDCKANLKKLTKLKEEAITKHILDLDL